MSSELLVRARQLAAVVYTLIERHGAGAGARATSTATSDQADEF